MIICTRNRAQSLALTLESLAAADRSGLEMEVRIVDNGSVDNTRAVVMEFAGRLPITYLVEQALGNYGKSHALNAALDAGGLGRLVAVIDDDISVREDWPRAVVSVSERWEDKSVFGGSILVSWPQAEIPAWALDARIRSWLFSAAEYSDEAPLDSGRWFSGNHFWFRSSVLEGSRRFKDIWLTEPDFILGLVEDGYHGLATPKAVVWHRVQPELLDPARAAERARLVGRSFARVRTQPVRNKVRQSVLLRKYPFAGRFFCIISLLKWLFGARAARIRSRAEDGFASELVCIERFYNYRELLLVAQEVEAYRKGFGAWAGGLLSRLALSVLGEKRLYLPRNLERVR